MKMKVFISGPMSGIEDFNRPAFLEAEEQLIDAGYSVFNPAWLLVDESWTRNDLMRIDISALTACDAIYQLPGWEKSEGAQVEYAYAVYAGKRILEKIGSESTLEKDLNAFAQVMDALNDKNVLLEYIHDKDLDNFSEKGSKC